MAELVGDVAGRKAPGGIADRQAAGVVSHGVMTIFIWRERLDEERQIDGRGRAISKAEEGLDERKVKGLYGVTIEEGAQGHHQKRCQHQRSRSFSSVYQACRQARCQRQDREYGNPAAEGGRRGVQTLQKRRGGGTSGGLFVGV